MNLSTVTAFKNLKTDNSKFIHMEGELLRRFQLELVEIMKDIVYVCEKYGYYYSLSGGSALGALRHKGFIPWDDDMDIFMLSSEKRAFIKAFQKEFNYKYWIHTPDTPGYGLEIGRIRLKGSLIRVREDLGSEECGFFIDIFWFENAPDNKVIRKLHGLMCMASGFALSCRNFYKNKALMLELLKDNPELKKVFYTKMALGFCVSFLSVTKCAQFTSKIYSACKNNQSKYLTVPAGRKHYFGEMYLRNDVQKVRKETFEENSWNVPANLEMYLENMYGNYMYIPKKEERETHVVMELRFPIHDGAE